MSTQPTQSTQSTHNRMRTPINNPQGKPPQSEQGYQRSIAQPSAAADGPNRAIRGTTRETRRTAKGRRIRQSRVARKTRRRVRRAHRRR